MAYVSKNSLHLFAICSVVRIDAGTKYLSAEMVRSDSAANKRAPSLLKKLKGMSYDPLLCGRHFPLQYETYKKTTDIQRTLYGGSEAFPRIPTNADPRTTVARSKLNHEPALRKIWAGYAFALD